jgi:hypothetical protein
MNKILNFDSFTKNKNIDTQAVKYLNNEITLEQLENYVFKTNEGVIGDFLNYVKTKIVDIFYTFLIKSLEVKDILMKVVNFAKSIIGKLIKFKEKHPTLAKVIFIFIIMVIILIVSAQSSQAHELVNGKLHMTNTDELNAAFGFIDQNHAQILGDHIKGVDADKVAMEAEVYLKSLINGTKPPISIGHEGETLAKLAIDSVKHLVDVANTKSDTKLLSEILNHMKNGMHHVMEITKSGNLTNVAMKVVK